MYNDISRKNENQAPISTDRCRRRRKGIVASSPIVYWVMANTIIRRPNPIKRLTVVEVQGSVIPPHCNARSRQQSAPTINVAPRGSSFTSFFETARSLSALVDLDSLSTKETRMNVIAPIGRLLLECQSALKFSGVCEKRTSRSTISS